MKKKIYWTEGMVCAEFGLQNISEGESLNLLSWLDAETEFSEYETSNLNEMLSLASRNINFWNEEELKMWFISDIVKMAHYNSDANFRPYFDREIAAKVQNFDLKVKVDFLIAKGVGDYVQKPYFCFHEYKRENKYHDDPVAQVLLAMLVAKTINESEKPFYGAYVIGRNWFFLVLENEKYAISPAFDSTQKEKIKQIIAILRKFKEILRKILL